MLEVAGLTKVFPGRRPVTAIKDITFKVEAGEVVGLLGPNGAGKTTTIKCVLGLVSPTAGRVSINGFDQHTHYRHLLRQVAAVLEGSRNVYWRLSVMENVLLFAGLHGLSQRQARPYAEHLLESFRLVEKKDVEVRNLSSGMKQKTAVACALVKRTPLVFLDEPTVGLDVETSYDLRRILSELAAGEGRTFVISSHDMHVIQDVCRRVVIISGGRVIADDSVEGLLSLFRTRSYHFALAGDVDGGLKRGLAEAFPQAALTRHGGQTLVTARLSHGGQLYDLIDVIRLSGAVIESVTQVEPDLERAYLELVRQGRETA